MKKLLIIALLAFSVPAFADTAPPAPPQPDPALKQCTGKVNTYNQLLSEANGRVADAIAGAASLQGVVTELQAQVTDKDKQIADLKAKLPADPAK